MERVFRVLSFIASERLAIRTFRGALSDASEIVRDGVYVTS